MKHSLVLCTTTMLACSSIATAGFRPDFKQQTPEAERRVQLPASSFLGAQLGEVRKETVYRLKLKQERGAVIEGVVSGSSAAKAGLQRDDVVVKWDGEQIESAREMSRHIRETPAGRTIRLGVFRDGREIEVSVKMGGRGALVSRPIVRITPRPEVLRPRVGDRGHLGVDLQSMTPQLAEYFGLSKRSGALVVFVFADSPAAKAGLRAGDVILSASSETVQTPSDLRRALIAKPEGALELKILREKQEKTVVVQIEKGTRSWLLAPDQLGDADSDNEMVPVLPVTVPVYSVLPASIALPRVLVPRVRVAPIAIPAVRAIPPLMSLPAMKLDLAPMVSPITVEVPAVRIPAVKLPAFRIPPIKIVIAPRRIVL